MNVPNIEFATAKPEELESECLKLIEEYLGRPLERADPVRLLLKSLLAIIIEQRLLINHVARMNLLAFSTGDYLERIGDLVGVERLAAAPATSTPMLPAYTCRVR